MELSLQFGFGMMEHCRFLVRSWAGGTVVLSPRDMTTSQMSQLSADIIRSGGEVLVDPQLYLPKANHQRLTSHDHWPNGGGLHSPSELPRVLSALAERNNECGANKVILPGTLASRIDGTWISATELILDAAGRAGMNADQTILTVALGSDAVRDNRQVELLVEAIDRWNTSAIYLIVEPPSPSYLVGDPTWTTNVLDIVASTKLAGKGVIVGYANQQMLFAACAGADAICSGTWMNVRSFTQGRFLSVEDDEIKQRSTWYYAPHLFSEYKIPTLDIAKKIGLLELVRTQSRYGSEFAEPLFTVPQPSLAGFTEQHAFRHFLQSMRVQAEEYSQPSFDQSLATYRTALDQAEATLTQLRQKSITGQQRDFLGSECIDANRAALQVLEQNHGPRLRRAWSKFAG
ncbi:hypothetical protein [Cupriavidus sp. SS-3]|uniref:hypothetical protein n=1 Tax=Cupriavidus sp. SS-3 TaxID=3109596 RepID=UPI002DC0504C|nr:hypothetical protein [Cupriavidus sp. SS-3]MEC3766890.1 hypothetical protein [Cupriavidus sp. SS-3]